MKEIGGYFNLDLPFFGDYFSNMLKYQSARAALRAVLEHLKATTLLMPFYICYSIVQSIIDSGVKPIFYSFNNQFFTLYIPNISPGMSTPHQHHYA